MKRKLVVLGDFSSFPKRFIPNFSPSPDFTSAPRNRTKHVDVDNALFLNCLSLDDKIILDDAHVNEAIERGIPIILFAPSTTVLEGLTGSSISNLTAAIVIKGKGSNYVVYDIGEKEIQSESFTTSKTIPIPSNGSPDPVAISREMNKQIVQEFKDRTSRTHSHMNKNEEAPNNKRRSLSRDIHSVMSRIDDIEQELEKLASIYASHSKAPIYEKQSKASIFGQDACAVNEGDTLPENRYMNITWINPNTWQEWNATDPWGNYSGTQVVRFNYVYTVQVLAANMPDYVKVMSIKTGGEGFEPYSSGGGPLADVTEQRGWFQVLTEMEYNLPLDLGAGWSVYEYTPQNVSDVESVTCGKTLGADFTAGGGPDGPSGSVSFSCEENESHTKDVTYWTTLAESKDDLGMKMSFNMHYTDNQYFNAPLLFERAGDETPGDEQDKLFWHNMTHIGCRQYQSLTRELARPDNQIVWYAPVDETRTVPLNLKGTHGLVHPICWKTFGCFHWNVHTNKYSLPVTINVDFSKVNYNDPSPS